MRDGPRRFPQNSSCSAVLRCRLARSSGFRVRGCHPCRRRFPPPVLLVPSVRCGSPLPRRGRNRGGLGSPLFDRLYWGVHCCFLFLRLLRCFSSPGSLLYKVPYLQYGGSPHSDILGSKPVCGSPGLFAAYRVFRRFLKPRHPPSALVYFLYSLHGLYRPCVIALSVVSKIFCPRGLCGE